MTTNERAGVESTGLTDAQSDFEYHDDARARENFPLARRPELTSGIESSDEEARRLITDGGTPIDEDTDTDVDTETTAETSATPDSDGPESGETECEDCEVTLTPSVREYIQADRENECELCSADGDDTDVSLSIHHRRERSKGGRNHPSNLLLLCQRCHRRHHNNTPIEQRESVADSEADSAGGSDSADTTGSPEAPSQAAGDGEPLPPRSKPNEADKEILRLLEEHGPMSTGELAAHIEYSSQYIRRECWKLGGEELIVPLEDKTWELQERADDNVIRIGLPTDPADAQRAGRDEVIRKMSAHGLTHTKIAEITELSRGTIDVAVNRARALRIDDPVGEEVDVATIATRLSALLELIDHAQMETLEQLK